jgi:hypothetical protein
VVCAALPPIITQRRLADFLAALLADRAAYTPEWTSTAQADPGVALTHILARYLEIEADGLNAMPSRLMLAFLDALGSAVLPAQAARTPLVFKLLDTATGDATVPAGTRVAAVLPPPPPTLDEDTGAGAAAKPEYFTTQEITAMRGKLAAVYSIDPGDDVYADHASAAATGFTLFDAMQPVPHRLYLGHDTLFRLAGEAQIVLTFDFATPWTNPAGVATRQRPLLFDWEYLSADGWLPLTQVEDRTQRFTRDGTIKLAKFCGPDAKQDVVAGQASYWIRGSVSSRVPSARIAAPPAAGSLAVTVESTAEILPGDSVTVDGVATALVLGTTADSILLDRLPGTLRAGDYLMLAGALPPLRPDGADEEGTLPQVDVIRASVGLAKSDLALDGAYLDGFTLDVSKNFFPFGAQPEAYASFYIACRDAFSRPGARATLRIEFVQRGVVTDHRANIVAEYYDGTRWQPLGADEEYDDQSNDFLEVTPTKPDPIDATIAFVVPVDWSESSVNDDKNFWLRLRIASGDFGHPLVMSVIQDPGDPSKYIVDAQAANLQPPILHSLRVDYVVLSNPDALDHCVTENDFAFADHSGDARWPRSAFTPFTPVSDRTPALHLGFSAKPPTALVSLLASIAQPADDPAPQPFVWDYWGERGWTEIGVRDATLGLSQSDLLQFIGAPDALAREGLGGSLYRLRGRLKNGLAATDYRIAVAGLWLNAAWASEGARYVADTLGISNGNPDQSFALPAARSPTNAAAASGALPVARTASEFEHALDLPLAGVPVIADEVVEVREWSGRGDDWQTAVGDVPLADIRFETDPTDRTIKTAAWVHWHARPHLYASGPNDRHYVVERARGVFRFPSADGFIPPAGAPIVVSYVTGGGAVGNVPAGSVRELHSGVGFVESVVNPLPASGGAGAESLRYARDRSAQTVRNRDRAVSFEDYEWLAREASSEVARARAIPLAGPAGDGARGFVGIVLVPQSYDPAPMPSPQLCARVLAFLRDRAPAGIANGIRTLAPTYVRVGIRAEVMPLDVSEAGRVEARLRARVNAFLHPLTGGRDGRGFEFGDAVYLSDLAALLEDTPGVDAVRFLQLVSDSALFGDSVPVGPDQLVAAGDCELKLIVPSVTYALA